MKKKISPCIRCTRVGDPENCTDKKCSVWRDWFVERWDQMRQSYRSRMDAPAEPLGVGVGGRHYAAPHQVQAYLAKDPCDGCDCPEDLCRLPCRTKNAWEGARKVVMK